MKGKAMYELSGRAEAVDWSDVAMAGRAYADNIVGEPALTEAMHRMADEIARLRLTEAEREAVEAILADPDSAWSDYNAAALRSLLERSQFACGTICKKHQK